MIPADIGGFLQVRFNELRKSLLEPIDGALQTATKRQEAHIRWNFPPTDWYVLNTDGAAKGAPGTAGGGAIIRDHGLCISSKFW